MILSSAKYGNQFLNDNANLSLNDVLKDPFEAEVQSMVDVPIHEANPDRLIKLEKRVATMSKIDHIDATENSVQANMINELKNQLPKYLPKLVSDTSSTRVIHFLHIKKHLNLYNALINSMDVDEANAKGEKNKKKIRHDHQDPPANADKDTKKRKRKDSNTSSTKKGKDQAKSSKEANALYEPSATEKIVDDEDLIQGDAVDDEELVQYDAMDAEDMTHDDAAPNQDMSKWFKQDAIMRPETLDPDWFKEPNTNNAPE
ncbi:hypothetical protein Tco_0472942 [Tanacetum coccineum]